MAGLGTGAPIVKVYHEKSLILPDVSRVLACLYEKDVKFETHTASYKSLLRLQASTHAPVPFYDGPTFLEESREICRYVAETYEHHGYPFLLGKDALERASIEQWLHHEEHTFNPASRALFCHLAFPLDREDDDIEMQKAKLEEVLEVYEQRLSDSEFLAGNKFTLADLVHLPNSHYITASSKFVYLYDSRKNVQRWWNDISTRASWKQVLSYMTRVEQQHKLEEFEKQKQQEWQREHRTAAGGRTRLYSQKHTITGTRSQTILVPPPPGTVSPSPIAPQADQPPPADSLSEKASVSSSQSTTTHKSLTSPNKQTTIFNTHQETPPDLDQSTQITNTSSTPSLGTFHTAPDKPPRIHADMSSIRDVSVPSDATETDLPTRPYIEPTPQKPPALLDTHSQTSLAATKEDSDQLNASDLYKSDRKSTDVYSEEKESISYTAHTFEGTYGKSTTQGATDSFPSNLHSTEHQMLQSKQWHAATSGLRNLQGDIDSMPSRQVKPSKDVQQYPPQDSEQASIRPVAQEPKSRKDKLVRGPEIIAQTPHTYQTRDASLQPQDAADARISEDETSFDRRKKGADWPKHSTEEDAQATPFQTTYDDSQGATQRAREASSVPRRTMDQDVHDTSQVIRTYGSAPSRLQPKDASQDVPLSSKKAPSKVPHTTTHVSTGYQGAQEFIQGSETPKQRPRVPYDAQGSTEEEKVAESPPSKAQSLGSRGPDVSPPKEVLIEDGYDVSSPLQARYTDDQDDWMQVKESSTSRQMNQDAIEETKMADSEPFKAQTLDSQQPIPQKQPPAEDPRFAASRLTRRYFDDQDSTKRSKHTPSIPRRMEVQDSLEETKAGEFAMPREQPSKDLQEATPPLRQAEAKDIRHAVPSFQKQETADSHSTTTLFQRRYPEVEDTSKELTHKPKETGAGVAQHDFEETKALDSATFGGRAQPQDTQRAAITPPEQATANNVLSATPLSPTRYPTAEDSGRQPRRTASTSSEKAVQDGRDKEPKSVDFTSSREQPSDVRRTAASFQKQESADSRSTTTPFQRKYPDVEDTTKKPRDKPKETLGEDSRGISEEIQALDSTLFGGRARPKDTHQTAITPSHQAAAKDAPDVTPFSPTRYPAAEVINRQLRRTASTPTEKEVQDGRDAFIEPISVDSTSSKEQPSDVRGVFSSLPKDEAGDSRRKTMPFQRGYPDIDDTTKEPRDKPKETGVEVAQYGFKEAKALDSTLFRGRAQPEDTQQAAITPSQQAAITPSQQAAANDALNVTPLYPTRYPAAEDSSRQPRRTTSTPTEKTVQDGRDAMRDPRSVDSTSSREQPSDFRQTGASFQKQEAADSHSTIMPFQRRYPDVEDTTKEPRDKPKKTVGEDSEETQALDSTLFIGRAKPKDTQETAITPSQQAATKDALSVTPLSPTRYPAAEDTSMQPRRIASTPTEKVVQDGRDASIESTSVDSTSSQEQPSDVRRASASLSNQEAADSRRTSMPFQRRYPDIDNTTKKLRDKPKETMDDDAQDVSEETKVIDSTLFRGSAQPQDTQQAATTPSQQAAATDSLSVTPLSPTRYPNAEDNSRQPRRTTSTPTEKAVQDGRYTFRELMSVDSTSSREQPSDVRQADASFQKQEAANSRSTTMPFLRRYRDIDDTTKEPRDKPKETVGQDVEDTIEESNTADSLLFATQPSDMPQAALTPSKKVTPEDAPTVSPPLPTRYPSVEDTRKQSMGTTTLEAPQDIREPKAVDSTSSPGPSDPLRASASLPKQEVDDAHRTTTPFQKIDPELKNTTKPVKDNISTSWEMTAQDAKDAFKETKIPDSAAPSMSEMDSSRTDAEAQAEAQDTWDGGRQSRGTWDKGMQRRETISARKEMVAKDAEDMSAETKTGDFSSIRQSPELLQASSQSRQVVPDNARGATKGPKVSFTNETIQSPDVKDTTRESRVASEEIIGPASTLDRVESFGSHDTQHSNEGSRIPSADEREDVSTEFQSDAQDVLKELKSSFTDQRGMGSSHSQAESGKDTLATKGGKTFSTEKLREMPIESEASGPTGQRTDSGYPSVEGSQQARTLPAGGKVDYSTPKHQPPPGSPSASHEKPASAPPREGFRDDYSTEYPMKKDTIDDQKEVPPLSSQGPTSQVQHASQTSQKEAPDNAVSTIDQWRLASRTMKDVTPISGDDVTGLSSDDQIPPPMGQETIPSIQDANESPPDLSSQYGVPTDVLDKTKKTKPTSTDQEGMAPTAGLGSTLESQLGGTLAAEVVHTDQKSTLADRESARATQPLSSVEPIKDHAADQPVVPQPIFYQQARTSPSITRQAQTLDNLGAISKIQEVSLHSQPVDYSAVSHVSTEEQVPRAPPPSASLKSVPAEDIHADANGKVQTTKPSATPDAPHVTTPAEVALSEQKLALAGQDSSQSTQLPSPDEPRSQENDAELTQAQPTPKSPPDLSSQYGVPTDVLDKTEKTKLTPTDQEGVAPTAGPGSTLESQLGGTLAAEVVHTDQKSTLPDHESARATQPLPSIELTKEDTNVSTADQPVVPQTFFYQQARTSPPNTRQAQTSDNLGAISKIQEVSPDSQPGDYSTVSPISTEEQVPRAPPPSASLKSTPAEDISTDTNGKVQATKPSATPDGPHVTTPGEVALSKQKLTPAGQDSSQSTKLPSPDEPRSQENDAEFTQVQPTPQSPPDLSSQYGVPTNVLDKTEKIKPTTTDQEGVAPTAGPGSTLETQLGGTLAAEVVHTDQKSTLPDRESAHATQALSFVEPTKEDTNVSAVDQPVVPQTIFYQQARTSPSITRQAHTSDNLDAIGKFEEVSPDSQPADYSAVSPILTEEQVPRAPPPSASVKSVHTEDIRADANGKVQTTKPSATPDAPHVTTPAEVALSEQKLALAGEDSSQSTQLHSPDEPRSQENDAELTQAQPTPESPPDLSSQYGVPADVLDKIEKTKPTSTDQEGMTPTAGPRSTLESQLGGMLAAEVVHTDQKSTLPDRESARATQPLSSVEPTKDDAADQPVVPQPIFYQQARTSPSITRQAQTSDNLGAITKIQEVYPDSQPANYSAVSPVLTEEQVPRAPPPSASVKSVPAEDVSTDTNGKVETLKPSATPDAPHVMTPGEVALSKQKLAPGQDSSQSTQLPSPNEPRSQENDAELTQTQPTPESPPDLSSQYGVPTDVLDKTEKTKPTSTDQEGVAPATGPGSTLESQLGGTLAAEVVHTDQKSTLPADQLVVPQTFFYQQARTSPSITRQAQTSDNLGAISKIDEVSPDSQPADYSAVSPVSTEEPVPRAPPPSASVNFFPAEDIPADANGKVQTTKPSATPDASHVTTPGEVALSEQKLAPAGQDSSKSTELPLPNEPRSQENDVELTQAQPTPKSPLDLSSQYGVPTDVLDKTEKTKPASIDQEGVAPTVPDPTQINSDILPTSGYGPTSSPNNQETQPLAGAQAPPTMDSSFSTFVQNRPANSLQNFDSSMPSATDEAVKAPMVNPTPTTDAPQGKDLAQSTQLPPSTESSQKVSKVVKDDQTIVSEPYTIQDTISSSVGSGGPSSSDSTYPTVKKQEFDPDAVKPSLPMTATPGDIQPSSPKEYMEVTEEISKQQQQTDQSSTESSKDENKPNGVSTSISTTTGDMHPSPPKESMESTEEARNQQKAQDSKEQVKDTEEQNTGTGEPEKSNLHKNMNQMNNGISQEEALDQSGKQASGVQQPGSDVSKSTKDTSSGSLMTPEEYMRDLQAKGNTQDEEIETAISETEQPKARDSQANTNGIISSQSEVQASEISERQTSSLEDMNRNSKETGGYLLATTSSNNKEAQPPAGTPTPSIEGSSSSTFLQNVPDNSLPNFDLPRSSTTDEAVKPPMLLSAGPAPEASPGTASFPAPAPDAPQDKDLTQSTQLPPSIQSSQKVSKVVKDDQTIGSQSSTVQDTILSSAVSGGSSSSDSTSPTGQNQEFDPDAVKPSLPTTDMDSVHPPREASLDFSSNEKTTSQGSQANNLPNISLSVSASQLVDQSENGAATGAPSAELVPSNSQENSQGMPIKEISKQQQQTDQSSTKSSKDDNKETNGGNAGISTKPKDIQPSPPKGSMEITEARNQQKSQDSMKQVEDVEEQNTGTGEPDKSNLGKNMNEKNNGISQDQALSQSGKPASGVELLGSAVPKSTKDTSSGIQTYDKSENSLMSSEEHTLDLQAKGNNTQGGEMETQTLETEQPKESDPQTNSNGIINNQSQAQASDIPEGQASSTEDLKGNSRETDSSTNDTKPGGTEDNTS